MGDLRAAWAYGYRSRRVWSFRPQCFLCPLACVAHSPGLALETLPGAFEGAATTFLEDVGIGVGLTAGPFEAVSDRSIEEILAFLFWGFLVLAMGFFRTDSLRGGGLRGLDSLFALLCFPPFKLNPSVVFLSCGSAFTRAKSCV